MKHKMWNLTVILCLLQISSLEASDKLDEFLRQYLQQKLTLDKARVSEAKDQIIPIAKILLDRIKEKDKRFDVRLEYRGSVYEKVKIKAPNEFDFDLVLLPLSLDREQENEMEDGVPIEYTTYKLSQSQQNEWKNMACIMDKSLLSAERVVATFANLVKQAVSDVDKEGKIPFQLNVKTNHPAVTISFMKNGKLYSDVDFAPVIEIKKWPKHLTSRWKNLDGNGQNSESNAQLLDALSKAQERNIIHGDDPTSVEEAPSFATNEDEIKWKLNKAKKTLHKARQLESLAKKAAVHFGYYRNMKQKHGVVSDLLSNAEGALLEAGDRMGFDYQKF